MHTRARRSLSISALALSVILAVGTPSAAIAVTADGAAPEITQQPLSVSVTEGMPASFSVGFDDSGDTSVQWESSADQGTLWTQIEPSDNETADDPTLVVPAPTVSDDGIQFRARVEGAAGSATSEAATLSVGLPEAVPEQEPLASGTVDDVTAEDGGPADSAPSSAGDDSGPGDFPDPGDDAATGPGQETAPFGELRGAGATGRPAPASAARLAPGTYTATVNPFVAAADAPIGVNVYMADASFPPVNPQKLNATLRVAADGTTEVDVPFTQEIFTLQQISSSDELRITDIERGGSIAWANLQPDPRYPDRIVNVTAELAHSGGEYTFGPAVQYPVPLATEKTWAIHLSVDFAGAVRQLSGDFTQTYEHTATGAEVTVSAEEGDGRIPRLTEAKLSATTPTPDHEAITRTLARDFLSEPTAQSWRLDLLAGEESIDLRGDIATRVTLPTDAESPVVFAIEGGKATRLETEAIAEASVTFAPDGLGTFAIVDAEASVPWAHTKTFESDLGTTMTYRTTGEADWDFPGMDFESLDSLGAYSSFLGEETSAARTSEAAALLHEAFENPDVRLFTFGLDLSYENVPGATVAKHSSWQYPLGGGLTSLSGSVPVSGDADRVYLVRGTVGSGLTSVEPLGAGSGSRSAAFTIVGVDTDAESPAAMVQVPLWNAATGKDGDIDSAQTSGTEIAYVLVASEKPKPIAKPQAVTALRYTGLPQHGVLDGEGYELSVRPVAADAGSYVARATLLPGFVWSDGSMAPVDIAWEITKAPLTATYEGETIAANGQPRLALSYRGFVNDETAATAAGFVSPVIAPPGALTAGARYELTPVGGSATNYRFSYVGGTLSVREEARPDQWLPGTYRVTANLFVPAAKNDILGLTAYMTNPKNPLVDPRDPNYGIPTTPVRDNASLIVDKRGTRSLIVDVPNPAFTLMQLGTPSAGVELAGVARDNRTYGANTGGRITQAVFSLDSTKSDYVFSRSRVYAAPLQLDKTWDIHLAVDYASATWLSADTKVKIPGGTPGSQTGSGSGGQRPNPGTGSGAGGKGGSGGKQDSRLPASIDRGAVANTQLAPGSYPVSANIWFSRADTGLPLDPHITSGAFPPKDPVADNATLIVSQDGAARVTVPVVIQDRILTVRSISGGGVVSTGGGSTVSSVTVDLGRIDPTASAIARAMTASVTIGDLAYSIGGPIFGGTREHTWPAAFEVNLSGVPTSGGGAIPSAIQTALAKHADSADAAKALDALEAARQANEESKLAGAGTGSPSRSGPVTADSTGGLDSSSLVATAIGIGALIALAGGATLLARHRIRIRRPLVKD